MRTCCTFPCIDVDAIDNSDLFEQVYEKNDIAKVPEIFDGLSSENVHFFCLMALSAILLIITFPKENLM